MRRIKGLRMQPIDIDGGQIGLLIHWSKVRILHGLPMIQTVT